MRLVLLDVSEASRSCFRPLSLSRPIWELRCGITSLGEKLIARAAPNETAGFAPAYMADAWREQGAWPINDRRVLEGDDLLLVDARVKADQFDPPREGPSRAAFTPEGECLFAWIAREDLARLDAQSIESLLESARGSLPAAPAPPVWSYIWELILANPEQLTKDFEALGRRGLEGEVEEPRALRGGRGDIYVAPGARVHPMVVLDAEHGPIYLDKDVVVHPFTRIEGPCYVGAGSTLLGAKCREGNSIGPCCRVGGEVEESIIQGYSNKYHDGFLGHAYVGQWVNLGALTSNSDLKNDYSHVSVTLDGRSRLNTGSTKVGSLIGDHTKTAIGTLFNTGAYVGAVTLLATPGKLLPKFIPSFSWFVEGVATKGFGKRKLYETAKIAMGRRGQSWTAAQEAMWNAVFQLTAPARDEAVKKGRRVMARS